jgi:hypothetical protein
MKSPIRTVIFTATTLSVALVVFAADPNPTSSAAPTPLRDAERNLFDDTYQFIFFAALEGLYRDGISDSDVNALLATKGKDGGYLNFIYTCPICMPVEGAIVTYKLRPRIDHMKVENYQTNERTFGFGLPKETSVALHSEKASIRLGAVNDLVSKWVSYRMERSSLTFEQKNILIEDLKKKRKQGMEALHNFARQANGPDSMKFFAPGYEGDDECAICNAALQMPLKLKSPAADK